MNERSPDGTAEAQRVQTAEVCALCGGEARVVARAGNYLPGFSGQHLHKPYPLRQCQACGTLRLEMPPGEVDAHLTVASHTDPEREAAFLRAREGFFRWLVREYVRGPSLGPGAKVLDFGPSFGHLSGLLSEAGFSVTAVETCERARAVAAQRAPRARLCRSLEELAAEEGSFSAIFALDSLYFVSDPRGTLRQMARLLRPDAFLLTRNTNRVWYYRWRRLWGAEMRESPLGDACWGFSAAGLRAALQSSGFGEVRVRYLERGKRMGWAKGGLYLLSGCVADWSGGCCAWSPGMLHQAFPERRGTEAAGSHRLGLGSGV